MLHPEIKHDIFRSMQIERLHDAATQQALHEPDAKPGLLTSVLNASGDLLIAIGTSLKHQAEPNLQSKTA